MASPSLPPDRSNVPTEQRHPRSANLDARDVRGIIDLMLEDHAGVVQAVRSGTPELVRFIDGLVERLRSGGRLIYLGAGTSGRLGVLDAAECPPTFHTDPSQVVGLIAGGDASLRKSSESREDELDGARADLEALKLGANDTVLGIAAGGTTPYVLGGLCLAKSVGATTGLLTCAAPATPPQYCDHLIVLRTGPEVLTGSTRLKAASATKLALNLITTATFVQLGKVYSNFMVDLRATNQKLTDRAIRILTQVCMNLSREQAVELLKRAEGGLKSAIIMQRMGVDLAQAKRLLYQHQGRLRAILDSQ